MTDEDKETKVRILDKEFRVNCPKDKKDELYEAASYLDKHMRQIKNSGRVIGLERIAVMAALNISHELSNLKNRNPHEDSSVNDRLQALQHKIDDALSENLKPYDKMSFSTNLDYEVSQESELEENADAIS